MGIFSREQATTRFWVPSKLRLVDLGQDIESKRSALIEQSGQSVYISDMHNCCGSKDFILGRIRIDPEDSECYYFQVPTKDSLNEVRMHYHDLEGLMVSSGMSSFNVYKDYPMH